MRAFSEGQEPRTRRHLTEEKHEAKDGKFFPPYPGWHGISNPTERYMHHASTGHPVRGEGGRAR